MLLPMKLLRRLSQRCRAACAAPILVTAAMAQAHPGKAGEDVAAWVASRLQEFESFYQDLHEHPELSFQERRTAECFAAERGQQSIMEERVRRAGGPAGAKAQLALALGVGDDERWGVLWERALAQEQSTQLLLQERAAELRAILDNAHDAFIALDLGGVVLDWNRQAEKLIGWTRENRRFG